MCEGLDVVIQVELVGMRTERDGVHLILLLVVDPGFDQIFGKDITLQQIIMVFLQSR